MQAKHAYQKVVQWVTEEGLSFAEPKLPADDWRVVIEDLRVVTELYQPLQSVDRINIVGVVSVPDEMAARIDRLDQAAKTEMLWELRLELLGTAVDFQGIELPFGQVAFSTAIFHDGLTKDNLFREWGKLRRAMLLFMWLLNRRLGEPPRFMPTGMVN